MNYRSRISIVEILQCFAYDYHYLVAHFPSQHILLSCTWMGRTESCVRSYPDIMCLGKPQVHTYVLTARDCGCVVCVLWMQSDVTAPRLNILPAWTHVSSAKSSIWQTNYAIQSWIRDIHVMSSHRQALQHFWVAILVRTTNPNWTPDAM